ncbi:MAG: DUF814 domain-containing protein [Bacteroidetes bacterium]|nr:DUF814 domain-containing protein [Bacteroidota bacterium]
MHHSYYFLRQLSPALHERICGFTIVSCFSQSKDELILELNDTHQSFFIRANLSASFSVLSFPEKFKRAKKNSIDLFEEIIFKKVINVKSFLNERSFGVELESGLSLIFKMHGNFANVLMAKENKVTAIFKNQLPADINTDLRQLARPIDFGYDHFLKNLTQLKSIYFTFNSGMWAYLETQGFSRATPAQKWELLQAMWSRLEKPNYYITQLKGQLTFSLLPLGEVEQTIDDPIEAINSFAQKVIYDRQLFTEKSALLYRLHIKIKNAEAYLKKNRTKQDELMANRHFQRWADLIMAHLHTLTRGMERIVLNDFYNQEPVEIKLKKELNPQQNATIFYRKAKNQQVEINKLTESVKKKEAEREAAQAAHQAIEACADLKTLRTTATHWGLDTKQTEKKEPLPYREFEFNGYIIRVGKNAQANDQLTLKHSYKDDLWLHAKDVAGSHVLVKYQAGKFFPKEVIEYAASLAAFYSKRKNETLCPVAFTAKKFVRKRKGDPAGAVVVEREEVILVEPKAEHR